MILYAMIMRARDGMPLSATTDCNHDANKSVKESKRLMKVLARKTSRFPDRCNLKLNEHNIYFSTTGGVSYLVLCESSYLTVLAFSFLNELAKEFTTRYEERKINESRRPYSFIEFDNIIHKTRQRYNKPQTLSTKVNLSQLSADIKANPPAVITSEDVEPMQNGFGKTNISPVTVGPATKLEPMSWFTVISVISTLFMASIDMYRGISALSVSSIEEYDGPSPVHGLLFLFEGAVQCFQFYLLVYYSRYRLLESWVAVAVMWLLGFAGWNWAVRDTLQLVVRLVVASAAHGCTLLRPLAKKAPNYNV
ncbi:vesicle-trafficking protein SEC22a-like [Ischnura elegans]|uniref:vesicle-trafficking protein SEC22a-like n=1 Tax=Ischnura elegans TaxID=197161 RepID=UPI001ED888FD|nr:vesicle-trafficking protein SEC22a-like [Ischnura elegans]